MQWKDWKGRGGAGACSRTLFARSREKIPGGVNSPVRAYKNMGMDPPFIQRGQGPWIQDAEGNVYIDYVCSWGPAILGHAHPAVVEAVQRAAQGGLSFGAPTKGELDLAELVTEAMPPIQKLRLVNSGTEAVMSALRLARGYTGRNYIIKFRGCYHGHSDGLLVQGGSGLLEQADASSAGVPGDVIKNTLLAEYNDTGSVQALFEKYGKNIAAVIVEPVAANMGVVPPGADFLPFLREITKQYGSLLVFDEVITGFRLAYGGACQYFGITPDLVTLGKVVGGGMPLAAYGGRREIMDRVAPLGDVYQAGTLSGNPVAVAAGIATLETIRSIPDFYETLEKKGERLAQGIQRALHRKGVQINRVGSLLSVFFTGERVENFTGAVNSHGEEFCSFFSFLLHRGIYTAPSRFESWFLSYAHGEKEIEETLGVMEEFGRQ